jgi:putative lipoprotein
MHPKPLLLLSACIFIGTLAGCAGSNRVEPISEQPQVEQITGTVTYRERIALTPTAELTVKLLDISLMDVAATELGSVTIINPGQVPVEFAIDYDPADVREGMSYSVRAEIRDRGRLIFTTDTVYPVLTRGAGESVDIVMIAVRERPSTNAGLIGTVWKLLEVDGTAIPTGEDTPEPYLRLLDENNAVEGFAGCNRLAGTYALEDDKLTMGPLAMTMMACVEGMETESRFADALGRLNRYEINGQTLTGYADDEPILKFAAD